eukprot:jgi/Mesen1/9993/ME000072S09409
MVQLTLEFSGGLELLFEGVKEHAVNIPPHTASAQLNVKNCLTWIRDNILKERPEMFLKGDSVRPGLLVLINDVDWELCGCLAATLQDGDTLVFISTLHGG